MRPPENSSDLTATQCEQMQARVGEMLKWLGMVLNRMNQLHFPQDDRLRREITEAYNCAHGLHITLHYMACERQKRESSPTGNYELYRRKRER